MLVNNHLQNLKNQETKNFKFNPPQQYYTRIYSYQIIERICKIMSYKAVFEFILLMHDFKNIDLPNQGLIGVEASIYQEQKQGKRNYGIPHAYPYQRGYKLTKKKVREQNQVNDMIFRSKVILIRYTEQLVPLDDFIQFRLQLQAFPYLNTDNIYLQLNLLFSAKYYSSEEESIELPQVAQVRMKLKEIQNGIICYSQADFKQDYFSRLGFTIYGQLMRFKFEKYQVKVKQPSSRENSRAKIQNFNKLIIWAKENYLKPGDDPFDFFYSNYVKKLRHSYYLIQVKVNNYLQHKRDLLIKVSKNFLSSKQITDKITQKQFRQYLQSYRPPLALDSIDPQVQEVHIDNFEFFGKFSQDLLHEQLDMEKMKQQYSQYIKGKYGQRVFRTVVYQGDSNIENVMKQNKKIAKQMRNKNISLTEYPCENQALLDNELHEFVFYEITMPKWMKDQSQQTTTQNIQLQQPPSLQSQQNTQLPDQNKSQSQQDSSNNTQKSDHFQPNLEFFTQSNVELPLLQYNQKNMLIVMCHGFQGSSYDMGIISKGIRAQLPYANYLVARSNQNDTECDIEQMGEKLADQVKRHIRNYMDQKTVIINFVGHSMGGIIARASLKYLTKYRQQLGFYCSLSSPHLGYLNGVDNKIKAGLWVLRKWKPIRSLDQLSMQQQKNPRKTFLYKLSRTGTLKYFRKLIFFSSFQDSYVSWHSARVSPHLSKSQQTRIQTQMVQNILGQQHGKNNDTVIHRLDINFNVKGNNIDSLIGRAAHINLIIQDSLFDLINVTLPKLFFLKQHGTGLVGQKKIEIGDKVQVHKKKVKEENLKNLKKEGSILMLRNQ